MSNEYRIVTDTTEDGRPFRLVGAVLPKARAIEAFDAAVHSGHIHDGPLPLDPDSGNRMRVMSVDACEKAGIR